MRLAGADADAKPELDRNADADDGNTGALASLENMRVGKIEADSASLSVLVFDVAWLADAAGVDDAVRADATLDVELAREEVECDESLAVDVSLLLLSDETRKVLVLEAKEGTSDEVEALSVSDADDKLDANAELATLAVLLADSEKLEVVRDVASDPRADDVDESAALLLVPVPLLLSLVVNAFDAGVSVPDTKLDVCASVLDLLALDDEVALEAVEFRVRVGDGDVDDSLSEGKPPASVVDVAFVPLAVTDVEEAAGVITAAPSAIASAASSTAFNNTSSTLTSALGSFTFSGSSSASVLPTGLASANTSTSLSAAESSSASAFTSGPLSTSLVSASGEFGNGTRSVALPSFTPSSAISTTTANSTLSTISTAFSSDSLFAPSSIIDTTSRSAPQTSQASAFTTLISTASADPSSFSAQSASVSNSVSVSTPLPSFTPTTSVSSTSSRVATTFIAPTTEVSAVSTSTDDLASTTISTSSTSSASSLSISSNTLNDASSTTKASSAEVTSTSTAESSSSATSLPTVPAIEPSSSSASTTVIPTTSSTVVPVAAASEVTSTPTLSAIPSTTNAPHPIPQTPTVPLGQESTLSTDSTIPVFTSKVPVVPVTPSTTRSDLPTISTEVPIVFTPTPTTATIEEITSSDIAPTTSIVKVPTTTAAVVPSSSTKPTTTSQDVETVPDIAPLQTTAVEASSTSVISGPVPSPKPDPVEGSPISPVSPVTTHAPIVIVPTTATAEPIVTPTTKPRITNTPAPILPGTITLTLDSTTDVFTALTTLATPPPPPVEITREPEASSPSAKATSTSFVNGPGAATRVTGPAIVVTQSDDSSPSPLGTVHTTLGEGTPQSITFEPPTVPEGAQSSVIDGYMGFMPISAQTTKSVILPGLITVPGAAEPTSSVALPGLLSSFLPNAVPTPTITFSTPDPAPTPTTADVSDEPVINLTSVTVVTSTVTDTVVFTTFTTSTPFTTETVELTVIKTDRQGHITTATTSEPLTEFRLFETTSPMPARHISAGISKSTLIASVTVSVLVPLLLLLLFYLVRRRRRVRFELVPPTVTHMHNVEEEGSMVSTMQDTQSRPLPIPPSHPPRPNSMQKDPSLFLVTNWSSDQQQPPPSASLVGELERSSSTAATVATMPVSALPSRPNPPMFPPPYTPATPVTGLTSTSQESQLPPYLPSETRT